MKIFFDQMNQKTVLFLRGEFVAEQVDNFRKAVLSRMDDMEVADFVLECSELEFVDSQGLESFLWLEQLCADRLGQICLVDPQDNVRVILEMTRLDTRLQIHDGIQTALTSLK